MPTGHRWDFQSLNQKKIMDTWKISFTWCSQTRCLRNSKLLIKLSRLWKLFGSAMPTTNKTPLLQRLESLVVHSPIHLRALLLALDHYGDLIMVVQMRLFWQCCRKFIKKTWVLKAFFKKRKIKTLTSDWWDSVIEYIRTSTQEQKLCRKCVTRFWKLLMTSKLNPYSTWP